jgi:hypothetical protein
MLQPELGALFVATGVATHITLFDLLDRQLALVFTPVDKRRALHSLAFHLVHDYSLLRLPMTYSTGHSPACQGTSPYSITSFSDFLLSGGSQ